MSDTEATPQQLYDELKRRGVFKDKESAAIGHELRRRGVVKDETQGGIVAPQSANPSPAKPTAQQQAETQYQQYVAPRDMPFEKNVADYAQRFLSKADDKNDPNILLQHIQSIPGAAARRAEIERLKPNLSEVGKVALLRRAYEHSGAGTGSISAAPKSAQPNLLQRGLTGVNSALSTPDAALKAVTQPLELSAYKRMTGHKATGDPVLDSATDIAERERIAALPFRERLEALRGQNYADLGKPRAAARRAAAKSKGNKVAQGGQTVAEMGINMALDPLTWLTMGAGSAAEGVAGKLGKIAAKEGASARTVAAATKGAKVAKAVPRVTSGAFAAQQLSSGAPTLIEGVLTGDPNKFVEGAISTAFGFLAAGHAGGVPEKLAGRKEAKARYASVFDKADRISAISQNVRLKAPTDTPPLGRRPAPEAIAKSRPVATPERKATPANGRKPVGRPVPRAVKPRAEAPTTPPDEVHEIAQTEAEAARQRIAARKKAAETKVPNSAPITDAPGGTLQHDSVLSPEGVKARAIDGFTRAADLYADAKKANPQLTREQFAQRLYDFHREHGDSVNFEGPSGDVKPDQIFNAKTESGRVIRYYGFSEKGNNPPSLQRPRGAPTPGSMSPDEVGVLEGMQYKRDQIIDHTSKVTDALKSTDVYDVDQGGRLTVWRDPDGKTWVVNGHHRLELAKRAKKFIEIGPDGRPADTPRQIDVNVLDANDGWTKGAARARGALENIRDNKGTALDAVEVINGLGIKPEEFNAHGISQKSDVAKQTVGLMNLDTDALVRVRLGDIPEASAAGIGSVEGLTPEAQRGAVADAVKKGYESYARGKALAEEYLSAQKDGTLATSGSGQIDMFGGEFNTAHSTMGERVDIKTGVTDAIGREYRDLLDPTKTKLREGEHIDVEARRAEARSLAETPGALKERLRLVFQQDAVKAEINRLAGELGNGKISKADAVTQIAELVRPHVGKSIRSLADAGTVPVDSGRSPGGQTGTPSLDIDSGTAALETGIFADAGTPDDAASVGAGDKIKAAADKAATDAKARIKKRKAQGTQSLGSLGGKAVSDYIEHAADYAIIGAAHVASGLVDFAKWSSAMVADFGEDIKEHLPEIWKASNAQHQAYKDRATAGTTRVPPKDVQSPPASNRASTDRTPTPPPKGGNFDTTPLPEGHNNQTKIANAHVEEQRALFGTRPLPDALRRTQASVVAHVVETGMHVDALRVASDVLGKGRAMSPEEVVANNLRQHQIKDDVIKIRGQIDKAAAAGQDITALKIAHNALMEDFTLLGDADRRAGTITAQALAIRKAVIDDYTYPNIVQRLRTADAKPLTPTEEAKVADVDKRLRDVERREKELDARRKSLDERKSRQTAERAVRRMADDVEKPTRNRDAAADRAADRGEKRIKLDKAFEELQKRLVKATSQLNAGIDPSLIPIIRDMARNRVEAGVLKATDVVDAVHAAIKDHVEGVTTRDVRDAISGYGQEAPPPKTSKLSELKRQMTLISQIEDAHNKVVAEKKAPKPVPSETGRLQGELKAARDANKQPTQPRAGRPRLSDAEKTERLKDRLRGKIADAKAGKLEAKRAPKPADPGVQKLRTELRTARAAAKPPTMKSALTPNEIRLERYKQRLRAMIDDYTERLSTKDFTLNEGQKTELDAEATELRARRDALKDIYDSLDPGKEGRVLQARRRTAETLLSNQISELQRRLAAKDASTPAKRAVPESPAIAKLKGERDALQKKFGEMKDRMSNDGSPYALRVQATRAAKAQQAALTRMNNRLAELNRRIATGDTSSSARRPLPDTPEKAALRRRLQSAQRQFDAIKAGKADPLKLARRAAEARLLELDNALRTEAKADLYGTNDPGRTKRVADLQQEREDLFREMQDLTRGPVQLRDPLAQYKKNTAKAVADLQRQIASGQPDMPVQRPVRTLDGEAEALAEEKARLRKEVDRMVAAREPKTFADRYRVWHRFAILSRTGSLAKLTAAATERLVFSPIEEIVGAPASVLLPGVARKAGIQGGFSFKAEAAALKVLGQRATYADALQKGKTGMNSLDALYGDKGDHADTPSLLDLPGRIHGLIKTPAQKAAFARAAVKLDAWARRNGMDVTDVAVKSMLNARAYQESLRHILMNHNTVTSLYRGILSGLSHSTKHPTAGRVGAALLRAGMPIVSVPTNFAGEVALHIPGGGALRAAGEIIGAKYTKAKADAAAQGKSAPKFLEVLAAKGVENLTPEQADVVLRALKKQGIGAALFAIGYMNSDKIGGFYTPGQKRDESGPEYGGIKAGPNIVPHVSWNNGPHVLWDNNIPHLLLHSPAIEALTVGATFKKAMDAAGGKKESDTLSMLGNGGWAAAHGIASSVPFFDLPSRIGEAGQGSEKAGRFLGSQAMSLAVPGIVPEIAGMMDRGPDGKVVSRRPRGFLDEVKMGIGMRRSVPATDETKKGRAKKISFNPATIGRGRNVLGLPKVP